MILCVVANINLVYRIHTLTELLAQALGQIRMYYYYYYFVFAQQVKNVCIAGSTSRYQVTSRNLRYLPGEPEKSSHF